MELLSGIFSSVWSIALIILFFGGSIFVHELGHFLAARRRGVKVTRFSIGFGPAIWSRTGRDGVEYRIAWIPLGGYVALPQLADMAAIEGDGGDAAALPPVTYGTRMLVFVAGATFNILFAFVLATVLWIVGQPTSEDLSSTRIGYVAPTIPLADGTQVKSPAVEAGLQAGDVIRAIDGTRVTDWPELLQTLVTSSGTTGDGRRRAIFQIERDGKLIDVTVFPRLSGDDNVRKVGILSAYTPIVAAAPDSSVAATIGLKAGDQLQAVDGHSLLNLIALVDALEAKPAQPVVLRVLRDTQTLDITVPADRPKDTTGLLGASFRTNFGLKYTNPFQQIYGQVTMTWRTLWSLVNPRSDIGISKLSGPIGIGKIYWDASEAGIRYVLWIAILVNVNLAFFNLLPIPVLDGGHMLFATIGKLRGRALPGNFVAAAQSVFIILLLSMILYVSVFDVRRIARDVRESQSRAAPAAEPGK